jgi:oxygen-independent coproporphyrinogen-3 oxidase
MSSDNSRTQRTGDRTTAGNYFVSNYPPYSFWKPERVGEASAALQRPPGPQTPLGIYLHIPFCRKRCHFCYFKVYTQQDAPAVQQYLAAVASELRLYAAKPFIGARRPVFIYFGGGTPSYISSKELVQLADRMKALLSWDAAEEITFECEPGTLTENKLRVIRDIGVTRLSLGIENFDDSILKANGRAHGSREIDRAYRIARSVGFPQINIDLIAGMVGETDRNWRDCVRRTLEMEPDSVTVYQMEIPYNTTVFQEMKAAGKSVAPVADWGTKRAWVNEAFSLMEQAGYSVSSAYTAVKDPDRTRFLYRDLLWTGADLIGLGVASFSHVNGTHYQNQHDLPGYQKSLEEGRLPIYRALTLSHEERLIRELILQFKLGTVRPSYFREKFNTDIRQQFALPLQSLQQRNYLEVGDNSLRLSREGLLQVDRLLPDFFLSRHRGSRYS